MPTSPDYLRLDRPRAKAGAILAGLLLGLLAFAFGVVDVLPRLLGWNNF